MTTEERYKLALENISNLAWCNLKDNSLEIHKIANEALNPPPEYEEVEVEAAKIIYDSGTTILYASIEAAEKGIERVKSINVGNERDYQSVCKYRIVRLTGIDKRPIKPKVKRREEIHAGEGWYWKNPELCQRMANGTKFYAEWLEE